MEEPISTKLEQLLNNTQLFLSYYNNKQQWSALYPLMCKLAQQYRELYAEYPFALQARLSFYSPNYSYAINLIINQCVLTAALCKSQNYNNALTELYISTALVEHLCVNDQLIKLGEQTNFDESDKKIWKLRHQLSAKIMLTGGDSAKTVTQLLAKLSKYKQALVSAPKIMLYDGSITLLALANIIAMNITYNASKKHISLFKALSDLYIRTPNLFALKLIKSLMGHIGPLLPGSLVSYSEQTMIYLATDAQQRHILISTANSNKLAWYRVKASLNDNPKQWQCADKTISFKVFNSEHISSKHIPVVNEVQNLLDLISRIKLQHEYSYKGLSQVMQAHPQIVSNLCEAVKPYNKEHQAAKDLKHSLSMVGYYNAPAIIQRVVFEQLVNVTPHPLHAFVVNRLDSLVKIMALLVSKNKHDQFEHITLPLYAYTHFLLTDCSTHISRKILINESPNKSLSTSICSFFGVSTIIDSEKLNLQLSNLLSDNPWTSALLEAEQTPKKHLTNENKLWVALKVVAQSVFKPELPLTSWQLQTFEEQLKRQGWSNSDIFKQQLQALGLSNFI
ncbi:hypothetical protein P20652_0863 [Pseudoalteromonas sp. BSi20652]|uniref:hypothetical protein n=1 Tax=Pseudoalteromonas sp. BSi20652 TaxID=388384 RepID=UPI000231AB3F|nr:hypothetical protein [Pseudoalteromonas sp. BSi20652]GAA59004.1 hypothetical protein P20652_0863 [Pseudoalteromonas sp. BSi20652]